VGVLWVVNHDELYPPRPSRLRDELCGSLGLGLRVRGNRAKTYGSELSPIFRHLQGFIRDFPKNDVWLARETR